MVVVPAKRTTAGKVTVPVVVSSVQSHWQGTLKLVCWPGVAGSRSIVLGTNAAPLLPAVSFANGTSVTAAGPVVVVLSLLAVGAAGALTPTDKLAWFEVVP